MMNSLVREFFKEGSSFQEILFLSESKESWQTLREKAPSLPRGWFELSRLPATDRIEFTKEFWLERLPFHPTAQSDLIDFFSTLDDVDVVLYRTRAESSFSCEMIYSLPDSSSFFRGKTPGSEEDLQELRREVNAPLPRDYGSFLRLHNGFGKLSEMGLLPSDEVGEARQKVMELLLRATPPVKTGERLVDPGSLIPFFEAGLGCYQCFYADWYPGSEMGNVYLSGIDCTMSDIAQRGEGLAFATFLEWLACYLQGMDLSP